ncbi:MAG: hypothetical protein MUE30_15175 [Spirosomaceae bacterium]|jgi:hypothetical protein|nr:hypothetical protein [Spirosomataceae bacterium]
MTHFPSTPWPFWRKLLFRFVTIYFVLYATPLSWMGADTLGGYYAAAEKWLVEWCNAHIFHIKDVLVPTAGSGDTSYGYAQMCFVTLVAAVGTLVWSLIDRRSQHEKGYYWLLIGLRYYVAMVSFSYGIAKVFALQMPFPSLSQLATPIGDLSPMRLAWFYIRHF